MKEKGWKYLKGAKDEPRKGRDDFTYTYKEGPMVFLMPLTSHLGQSSLEIGATPSRFKHVVKFKPKSKKMKAFDLETKECQAIRKEFGLAKSEWLCNLTPVEDIERLNMFPDNHTEGPTDGKRAFFMGNALVIGIIKKLGEFLQPKKN